LALTFARSATCPSPDQTTTGIRRASGRANAGEAASVFSLGGAKPAGPDDDPDGKPTDEDDALVIPGLGGFGGRC